LPASHDVKKTAQNTINASFFIGLVLSSVEGEISVYPYFT
jgi:hypothetical protein